MIGLKHAVLLAQSMIERVSAKVPGRLVAAQVCGSVRRKVAKGLLVRELWSETMEPEVKDVDLAFLWLPGDRKRVEFEMDEFEPRSGDDRYPEEAVDGQAYFKKALITFEGHSYDLFNCFNPNQWGALTFWLTGPASLNARLKKRFLKRGKFYCDDGLLDIKGAGQRALQCQCPTEFDLLNLLDLRFLKVKYRDSGRPASSASHQPKHFPDLRTKRCNSTRQPASLLIDP